MNTALPEGEGGLNEDFLRWREFIGMIKEVPVPGVIGCYCPRRVALIDMVAYAAPFPGARYQAGVRRFPDMVPIEPDMAGIEQYKRAREFLS